MSPREIRKQLGLSQPAMAKLMRVHLSTWVKWEYGDREPNHSAVTLMELLVWLNENAPRALDKWRQQSE